jgi:Holliday junction resolvasome RuvABC ATP-dependent DNA helicase subunit
MIGIDNITNLLELVVWSGHIRGEQPVSAMLTAPPEAGKTSMVMKYASNERLVVRIVRLLESCVIIGQQ